MEDNKIIRKSYSCKDDTVKEILQLQKKVYVKTGNYYSQSKIIVSCVKNADIKLVSKFLSKD